MAEDRRDLIIQGSKLVQTALLVMALIFVVSKWREISRFVDRTLLESVQIAIPGVVTIVLPS